MQLFLENRQDIIYIIRSCLAFISLPYENAIYIMHKMSGSALYVVHYRSNKEVFGIEP